MIREEWVERGIMQPHPSYRLNFVTCFYEPPAAGEGNEMAKATVKKPTKGKPGKGGKKPYC